MGGYPKVTRISHIGLQINSLFKKALLPGYLLEAVYIIPMCREKTAGLDGGHNLYKYEVAYGCIKR